MGQQAVASRAQCSVASVRLHEAGYAPGASPVRRRIEHVLGAAERGEPVVAAREPQTADEMLRAFEAVFGEIPAITARALSVFDQIAATNVRVCRESLAPAERARLLDEARLLGDEIRGLYANATTRELLPLNGDAPADEAEASQADDGRGRHGET